MKACILTDTHYNGGFSKQNIFVGQFKKETFNMFIHCGDIASSQYSDIEEYFIIIRDNFPSTPFYVVWGNHDLWMEDKGRILLEEKFDLLEILLQEYNIQYLPDFPIVTDNFYVGGIDGWYNNYRSDTNDYKYFENYNIDFATLRHRSFDQMNKAVVGMNKETTKRIYFVSHFDLYPQIAFPNGSPYMSENETYFNFLPKERTVHIFGHTHYPLDREYNGVRLLNVGSDYGNESYRIIDL